MRRAPAPPLFGRQHELALLRDLVQRAAIGEQELALLEGEAGSGKTALLTAFAAEAMRRRGRGKPRLLLLQPPAGTERYEPVRHAAMAATHRRFSGSRRGAQATELARGTIVDWLGVLPVIGNVASALAATAAAAHRLRRRSASREPNAWMDADTRALLAAARRRPLVLLLDGLERADEQAVARLQALVEDADAGARILIVAAYRPTAPGVPDPPIHSLRRVLPARGERFVHHRLVGLDTGGLHDWLAERYPGAAAPAAFVTWLRAATGGHPGTVESTLLHLEGTGAIRREGAAWRFETAPDRLELPALADSADALDAIDRSVAETVRAASALDEEFTSDELARALGRDELAVEDHLALGVHFGVLELVGERELDGGDVTTAYRFASAHLRATILRSGATPPRQSAAWAVDVRDPEVPVAG